MAKVYFGAGVMAFQDTSTWKTLEHAKDSKAFSGKAKFIFVL